MKIFSTLLPIAMIAGFTVSILADDADLEVLAKHNTIAKFEGSKFRLCRGRTAACPEKCGDSGEYANFTILRYTEYEKPGKYGDPKQESYSIQISDFHKKPVGDPELAKTIASLKQGDEVVLGWNHLYGEIQPGLMSPKRVVVELKKVGEKK